MLKFDHVELGYRRKAVAATVAHNLSFSVPDGCVLGVVGPSGIGKSTLLKTVAGALPPLAGDIVHPLGTIDTWYLPQSPVLIPFRNCVQNALFAREVLETLSPSDIEEALFTLRGLGLESFISALPGALSGGMRRRLALAQGLLSSRTLILMDEPLAELDYNWRLRTEDLIGSFSSRRRSTYLLASHDIDSVVALADEVLVMQGPPPARVISVDLRTYPLGSAQTPQDRRKHGDFAATVAHLQKFMWQRHAN